MTDGPEPLRSHLESLLRFLQPRSAAAPTSGALGAVFSTWDTIVGDALAGHSRPLKFSGGTLLVAVDHPAWATQVRALTETLKARVGEVGGVIPDTVRVVVRVE